ncbi:MAG: DUF3794 domain-containing protein [Candidatus Desulforudis sp.]|nr:DUF3794 domain-containing protein [Desulforudis sp.]
MSHITKVRIVCQEENVQQVIGEKTVQTVVRGTITIPNEKPRAEQILAVRAQIEEDEQEEDIIADKVIIQGKLVLNVTFVADKPDQPVHHVRGQIEFAESVPIPGARPDQDVVKQITIETVKGELDPRDPRRITVTVILRIFVKVVEVERKQLLIDLPGAEKRFRIEPVKLDIVKAMGKRQVAVSEQFDILRLFEAKKPCPEEILDTITDVTIDKKEVIDGKVLVEGTITVQVIYVALIKSQPVHHAHFEIPFVTFVDLPKARPGDMVNVQVRIEDASARVKDECEIMITVVLEVKARIVKQIQKELVVKIDQDLLQCLLLEQAIRPVTLFLDQILNEEDMVQVTLREIVTIPQEKPAAQKILEAIVTDIEVTETEVIPNKVIVRGVATVKVVYVADRPDQPVHAFEAEIPFTAFIDVPGAEPGVDVNVMVNAEFAQASLDNDRRVAVKLVLRITVRVADIVQKRVFECLRPSAVVECPKLDPLDPKMVTT